MKYINKKKHIRVLLPEGAYSFIIYIFRMPSIHSLFIQDFFFSFDNFNGIKH